MARDSSRIFDTRLAYPRSLFVCIATMAFKTQSLMAAVKSAQDAEAAEVLRPTAKARILPPPTPPSAPTCSDGVVMEMETRG